MTKKWSSERGRVAARWRPSPLGGGALLVCEPVDPVVEHLGGVRLPLSQSEEYNASAIVGRETSIQRLVDDLADIVDHAIADRFAAMAEDFKAHPDHYLPPYQFPESAASEGGELVEWS